MNTDYNCCGDMACFVGSEDVPTTATYARAHASLSRADDYVDVELQVSMYSDGRGVDVDFFRNGEVVEGAVFDTQGFRDFLKHLNRLSNSGIL